MSGNLTDFNDLHCAYGIDEVRKQVLASLENVAVDLSPDVPADSSPRPSEDVGRVTLDTALQRFSFALPDGKVWDGVEHKLIKQGAAKAWWGAKIYADWLNHEKRATVRQDDVLELAAAAKLKGRGGLSDALARYIYLYPTSECWDVAKRQIISLSNLKHAIADVYDDWLTSPSRKQIDADQLVFDPGGPLHADGRINTFRGLPLKPANDMAGCWNIIELLKHLCNHDETVVEFVLCWLAFPLQNIGAKMASALMFHSSMHGSGKSLFFDEIMQRIYGEYGATLGQHQLESSYTDWRSKMLFGLFEEIFSRDQKYNHSGTVKHMITGKTQRIEKKFISGWEESNHMNLVFLSNEHVPQHVEPSDRRFLVVWPREKLSEGLKRGVLNELERNGAAAFYNFLLNHDCSKFHSHHEPPMTDDKRRLIEFGLPNWQRFLRDWRADRLEWPYKTCLLNDLYRCYRSWCNESAEKIMPRDKFSGFISTDDGTADGLPFDKRMVRRRDLPYMNGQSTKKGTFVQVGPTPKDIPQADWLAREMRAFSDSIKGNNHD